MESVRLLPSHVQMYVALAKVPNQSLAPPPPLVGAAEVQVSRLFARGHSQCNKFVAIAMAVDK